MCLVGMSNVNVRQTHVFQLGTPQVKLADRYQKRTLVRRLIEQNQCAPKQINLILFSKAKKHYSITKTKFLFSFSFERHTFTHNAIYLLQPLVTLLLLLRRHLFHLLIHRTHIPWLRLGRILRTPRLTEGNRAFQLKGQIRRLGGGQGPHRDHCHIVT